MIKAIACVDSEWALGKNNDLLFHLKKDMKHFAETTKAGIVVCGYNTLLSFPKSKPLPGRTTICLCPEEVNRNDCYCIHDFNELVKLLKELSKTQTIWVIGGAMLYNSLVDYYDEVLITKVYANGEGTVFFPNLDMNSNFISEEMSEVQEDNGHKIQLFRYKKLTF